MKLISIQEALWQISRWVDIPPAHELINSGIYRSPEYDETPFYKIELEWNKAGEPELTEDGLVGIHMIRAELDAHTGRLLSFYRHEYRQQQGQKDKEMDETLYESLYPHVLKWIVRLEMPIDPSELRMVRKTVMEGGLYRMSYQQEQGA